MRQQSLTVVTKISVKVSLHMTLAGPQTPYSEQVQLFQAVGSQAYGTSETGLPETLNTSWYAWYPGMPSAHSD